MVRAAGTPVELERDRGRGGGARRRLALSVYRIVQEALTNVVKHAGRARAHGRAYGPVRPGCGSR